MVLEPVALRDLGCGIKRFHTALLGPWTVAHLTLGVTARPQTQDKRGVSEAEWSPQLITEIWMCLQSSQWLSSQTGPTVYLRPHQPQRARLFSLYPMQPNTFLSGLVKMQIYVCVFNPHHYYSLFCAAL